MIVIAKYKEDVRWSAGLDCVIYDKSKKKGTNVLPNIGRESHTYLTWIIDNYDNLPNYAVLTQGNPFDHCKDFLNKLHIVKPYYDFDMGTAPHKIEGDMLNRCGVLHNFLDVELLKQTILIFKPDYDFNKTFLTTYYGIFGVSKDRILRYTKEQYQQCLDLHTDNKDMPYVMELIWRLLYEN